MPNPIECVEIITGRERRRRYSAAEKVRLVEETTQPGMTVSAVARLHGVSPSLLFGWRRRMAEGGLEAVRADDDVVAASRQPRPRARGQGPGPGAVARTKDHGSRDPPGGVGRYPGEKARLAAAVAASGRFPVKAVADTLVVLTLETGPLGAQVFRAL